MLQNQYVIASITWLESADEDVFRHLNENRIMVTGYRPSDGVQGLFSVVVNFLDVPSKRPREAKKVTIHTLVDGMEARLPNVDFVLTAGTKPIAECKILEKITTAIQ